MRGLCTGSLDPEGLMEGDVDSGGDAFRVGYGTRKVWRENRTKS